MNIRNSQNGKATLYCDLTVDEDMKLMLIGKLLLQTNEHLEAPCLKELGNVIHSYLAKKCLMDHFFWGRTLASFPLSETEKEAGLASIKIMIGSEEL